MRIFESKKTFISPEIQNDTRINFPLKKEAILCTHCKRTATNGIRCLGMCVADNDY